MLRFGTRDPAPPFICYHRLLISMRYVYASRAASVGLSRLYSIAAPFRAPLVGVETELTDDVSVADGSSDETATGLCDRPGRGRLTSNSTLKLRDGRPSGFARYFERPESRKSCV